MSAIATPNETATWLKTPARLDRDGRNTLIERGFHSITSSIEGTSITAPNGYVFFSSNHADKYEFLNDLLDFLDAPMNPRYFCERWRFIVTTKPEAAE